MLPSSSRLPASEIRAVLHTGKRFFAGSIQGVVLPTRLAVSRFAFIVSTSVDKRATVRNRMRRLLREAARSLLPSLQNPVDAVLTARKGMPDAQQEVNALLADLFHKANLV